MGSFSEGVAPLLEREAELDAVRAALTAAVDGQGSVTVVTGQAGAGKSRLLREAVAEAELAGLHVLRARGDAVEREFAFGVALGLFEATIRSAERRPLFAGAARLAEPLFDGMPAVAGASDPQAVFSLVHGLFWLVHNLAENGPILLVVDDVQWADAPSLRFLAYVSQRVTDLPVVVMAGRRTGEEHGESTLLREFTARPSVHTLSLEPLSPLAVSQIVRERLPGASDGFCEACADATAGNPLYLEELLRTVVSEGVAATDDGAAEIRALAPTAVSNSILLRLSRFPEDATSLARAVAVLGETPVRDAAELARLHGEAAARLAAALAAAGILVDRDPVSFSHPIVRAAVYADAAEAERGRLELRASRLLLAGGAPPERVCAHLLLAPAAHEPWIVAPLRLAAARAAASGAVDSAVRYLRRAAEELPPGQMPAELLVELGQAECAIADPHGPDRLLAALEMLDDPLVRARTRLVLGRALSGLGRFTESAHAFERGADDARGRDPDLLADLEAGFLGVARFEPALHQMAAERIELLLRQPPNEDAPGQRPVLADLALARAWAGAPAAEVRPLVDRAWAGGTLLDEQGPDSHSVYILTGALQSIDELELTVDVLDAALREAHRRGSVMAVATASSCRSHPLLLQARIPEALADAELAVGAESDGWEMFVPTARALLARAAIELGDLDAAAGALELPDPERWVDTLQSVPLLDTRARLRLEQRRPAEALVDALETGRLLEETFGGTGRGYLQWRCTAARAAASTGDRDQAQRLLADELEVARAGDRAREIGATLRTMAALETGERRIPLLEEAVATLEHSQTALELLYAVVDLGGALRRAGRRQDARPPLERALDVATRRGASALARRAREELLATGARPRRTALRGVAALTPSELRVARLAGEGLLNREIAEALFVSRKTVDFHLRHVYQKLDVTREQLADALAAVAKA